VNRLWVQLSAAFGAVVLISALVILGTSLLFGQASGMPPSRLNALESDDGFASALTTYYRLHNSWEGVDAVFMGAESSSRPRDRFHFRLRDASGKIVYDSKFDEGKPIATLSIAVNNVPVGSLDIAFPVRADVPDNVVFFLRQAQDLMLSLAAIGAFGGLFFGILAGRWFSRPLDRLAAAARAFGTVPPYPRVKVSGTREVADVARAFNEMADEIEQAEIRRRHMVADIAHELRTPLSIMRGNLLAILDGVYPLEQAEIATLYEQTSLLTRLVEDLHELSMADANQLKLQRECIETCSWLDTVVSAFHPVAESQSITLTLDCAPNLPQIMVDSGRMTQVMDNLIGNALRHTPALGTISVKATQQSQQIAITVEDTGSGIPAEHIPYVFDRFYRTDLGRNRAINGSGLGLAIVRAMVLAHGGTVSVESAGVPGQGSTFIVRIPTN